MIRHASPELKTSLKMASSSNGSSCADDLEVERHGLVQVDSAHLRTYIILRYPRVMTTVRVLATKKRVDGASKNAKS